MHPPRWFYALLGACVVALTVAAVLHFRWRRESGHAYFDSWTSRICLPGDDRCLPLGGTTRAAPQSDQPVRRVLVPAADPNDPLAGYTPHWRDSIVWDSLQRADSKRPTATR